MKEFLLLLDSGGSVITRDELFGSAWGGAFVGDDSLNRAIGQVRKVAAETASGLFEIETVPRTGYRLMGPIRPCSTVIRTRVAAVITEAPAASSRKCCWRGAARSWRHPVVGKSIAAAFDVRHDIWMRPRRPEPVGRSESGYDSQPSTGGPASTG